MHQLAKHITKTYRETHDAQGNPKPDLYVVAFSVNGTHGESAHHSQAQAKLMAYAQIAELAANNNGALAA